MSNKKSWSSYYESRVNNDVYLSAFKKKYGMFLNEIVVKCKEIVNESNFPIVFKEEGCGIGMVSKAISGDVFFNMYVRKLIFSDINCLMLNLCFHNINGYFSDINGCGENILTPCLYATEDITKRKFYEPNTVIVTHGVLEHFSDEDIQKIMDTYDTDKVIFQAHYVPTIGYTEKSFGNERLLSISKWIELVKPDYWLIDNMGKDLYLFKIRR